jgi:hypothetical protein
MGNGKIQREHYLDLLRSQALPNQSLARKVFTRSYCICLAISGASFLLRATRTQYGSQGKKDDNNYACSFHIKMSIGQI